MISSQRGHRERGRANCTSDADINHSHRSFVPTRQSDGNKKMFIELNARVERSHIVRMRQEKSPRRVVLGNSN